ncbi:FAD-dependent oxidoreductase, partial [Escherichia coli]|nr:FAD-dependent oxidoreductase [Escherichia coli]
PNTDEIGLEQAGVKVTERGLVEVDKQGRSNVPNIFAIGDIVPGVPLAHKASYEAKIAAEAIAGEKAENDYTALPAVVFSDPELATVGLTEKEAKEKGFDVKAA